MTAASVPNALLEGGPASLLASARVLCVTDPTATVKVVHGNGREHFTPTRQTVNTRRGHYLLVYRWSGCTKIAE